MKSFKEMLSDIEKLKGKKITVLKGNTSFILYDIDFENKRIVLKLQDGSTKSRPFEELKKIYNDLIKGGFVHVDTALGGSGSSRNQPEAVMASLPYIDWGQYMGKKCLILRNYDTHELGKTRKLSDEEVTDLDNSINKEQQVSESREGMNKVQIYDTSFQSPNFSLNRIIFGAPGTGKSWQLNHDKDDLIKPELGGGYERVTFHPDYTYSQFVGAYKPVTNNEKKIVYDFVPGPFMRVYVNALRSARNTSPAPWLLIIEEINRAQVAAVFGDIFQLLDRGENGVSEYEIQASEDVKKYLAKELDREKELDRGEDLFSTIKLPNNMFIWATMNSADQGVFPMDTAFKRRWDFEYIGIDQNEDKVNCTVDLVEGHPETNVNWNKFRKAINAKLQDECRVNEDKLLGPFFLSKNAIKADSEGRIIDPVAFRKAFKSKVIMYLYEDAGRQYRQKLFDPEKCKRYSYICEEFDVSGMEIFGKDFKTRYYDIQKD